MEKNISLFVNHNDQTEIILGNIWKTNYAHERLVGLMFKKDITEFDGLIINDCGSIHTCFMFFPIDAYFFDRHGTIIRIYKNLVPWRFTMPILGEVHVLETNINKIKYNLQVNQRLEFRCTN